MRKIQKLFAAIAAVCAFGGGVDAAERLPDLVIGVNTLARGLEPAEDTGNPDVRVIYSIFDTLLRRDFKSAKGGSGSSLKPHLAVSWTRIDPRTVEVTLRRGVKFHNGAEMTAEDILFTFSPERMVGPKALIRGGNEYFGHLEKVEAAGPYKVRFVTKGPDLIFEQRLATYASWIVSKKSWVDAGKPDQNPTDWMSKAMSVLRRAPVGTGPLKFVEWKEGEHQKFVAFDGYFAGKPPFRSVTFRQVPEVATRIAGLVSGEFDIIVNVPPDQIPVLERYDNVTTRSVVLSNSHVLTYNTTHPVIKDKRVRHALDLAIDRGALLSALWQNKTYTPNGHQMPDFGDMYLAERKPPAYDPDRARALLEEAGYKGEPLSYKIIPNYYVNAMSAAQIMQQMWKKVGLNVKIEAVESFKQVRSKDVAIYPWSNTYRLPDPTGALMVAWGETSAIQRKYKYWKAPKEFNDMGHKILSSTDIQTRREAFSRMLDIFEDEQPTSILYNPLETYAMKKSIDWTPYPIYYMDLRGENLKIGKTR